VIGKGSFGSVYKVRNLKDQQYYALKQIFCKDMQEATFALKEFMTIQNLKHKNLVEYKDFFLHEELGGLQNFQKTYSVCILMPLYDKGDLEKLLNGKFTKRQILTEFEILDFSVQLCEGVKYLHEHGIIHRDMKPGNVFVEEINGKYLLKIGDFGLSAKMNNDKDVKHSIVGTHAYCAPEVFTGSHGKEIDLFSLGALIYRFLTGRERYMHQEITLAYDKTIGEMVSEITRNYPNDWCKVVVALLAPKPDQRPSIDVVIKYLNDYQTKLSDKLKKTPIPLTNPMVQQNVEPIKVVVIKQDPIESNSIFKYEYELKTLCDMGFGDIALNKLLLKKYSGDIVRSVGEILNAK